MYLYSVAVLLTALFKRFSGLPYAGHNSILAKGCCRSWKVGCTFQYYPKHKDFRPFVRRTQTIPLDSERGCTGELWLKTKGASHKKNAA